MLLFFVRITVASEALSAGRVCAVLVVFDHFGEAIGLLAAATVDFKGAHRVSRARQ